MEHYNYNRLRGLIKEHCGSQIEFANRIGISPTTLTNKMNQKTNFTQCEMRKALEVFGLPMSEVDSIFFNYEHQKADERR